MSIRLELSRWLLLHFVHVVDSVQVLLHFVHVVDSVQVLLHFVHVVDSVQVTNRAQSTSK